MLFSAAALLEIRNLSFFIFAMRVLTLPLTNDPVRILRLPAPPIDRLAVPIVLAIFNADFSFPKLFS